MDFVLYNLTSQHFDALQWDIFTFNIFSGLNQHFVAPLRSAGGLRYPASLSFDASFSVLISLLADICTGSD